MSRIGKKPVPVPSGVKVSIAGRDVTVEGPKGKLDWTHHPDVTVVFEEDAKQVVVTRNNDERLARGLHGLTRALIANMVEGVTNGYRKNMEVYGVGYGAQLQGNKLTLSVGLSHQVEFEVPMGLTIEVTTPQARGDSDPAKFSISGIDKQLVGEFAANVRKCRPPEPYKGKGVRYAGEHVRRKVGKAFAAGGA
jgi:large subunit ribosomal protein L6